MTSFTKLQLSLSGYPEGKAIRDSLLLNPAFIERPLF